MTIKSIELPLLLYKLVLINKTVIGMPDNQKVTAMPMKPAPQMMRTRLLRMFFINYHQLHPFA